MALTNGWDIGADQGGAWNIGAASQGPITLAPDSAALVLADPSPAVSIDIVLAIGAPPTWTATPLGAFVHVDTSVVPRLLAPGVVSLGAPDVTVTIQLVPDPAVLTMSPLDPLLLGPVPSIKVSPGSVQLQLSAPAVVAGPPVFLSPDPAVLSLVAPASTLNRILAVGSAALRLLAAEPDLDRTLLPDPVVLQLGAPDFVLDRVVPALAAAAGLTAPDITLAGPLALVTLTPDPSALLLATPDIGADRILNPDAALVQLAQDAVQVARIFSQRPVAAIKALAPTVSINIAPAGQSVSPDPAVLSLVAPASTLNRTLLVGPAVVSPVTLETQVPRDLGPDPAAVLLPLPEIQVSRILTPGPAALVAGPPETSVTAPASGTLTPAPAVLVVTQGAVEVPRVLEPRPVLAVQLVLPEISLTVIFGPGAGALQLQVPDPLIVLDQTLSLGPASIVLALPDSAIDGGIDLTPAPAIVVLRAPTITTLGDTLKPGPAVLALVLPVPLLEIPGRPMVEAELAIVETLSTSLGVAEGLEILAPIVATLEESLGASNVLEAALALTQTMNHPKHL